MATAFVDGPSLQELVEHSGPLTPGAVRWVPVWPRG